MNARTGISGSEDMMVERGRIAGTEALEPRRLLAHVGLDLNFGDVGRAEANGSLLVTALPGGKTLAGSTTRATRLNADGSVDESFFDEGGAQAAQGKMKWIAGDAVVSGDRLYIAGVLQWPGTKPAIFSN